MRYTIVTPTICRQSLVRLCESIDKQTQKDWEHLVVIDMPRESMNAEQRAVLRTITTSANRSLWHCEEKHKNFGHTCRYNIWEQVKGRYIFYIDDDDYLADADVLRELDTVTEPWAVFPILRRGARFFNLPPACGGTGTGMFIHKKEIGRWPNIDAYEADGKFVEELVKNYSYQALDVRPLVIQPVSSGGVSNAETWFGKKRATLVLLWHEYWSSSRS